MWFENPHKLLNEISITPTYRQNAENIEEWISILLSDCYIASVIWFLLDVPLYWLNINKLISAMYVLQPLSCPLRKNPALSTAVIRNREHGPVLSEEEGRLTNFAKDLIWSNFCINGLTCWPHLCNMLAKSYPSPNMIIGENHNELYRSEFLSK